MTSFVGSMILVLLSFAVLVFLIMKGVALLPSALAAGCVLALAVDGGWINGLFTLFSEAAGSYAASLLIPFMAGGVFGAIMIATGSDIVIGRTIINKFGTGFAIYALALFVAIMGAAGISSWPYLAAIFAFSLMRASNLPIKIACVTMVGINSAFSFILAGLPTLPNILASQAFGTTLYAGMGLSVVMCAVQCVLVLLYVNKGMIAKARKNGDCYVASPIEQSLRGETKVEDENLPSFLEAVIPLILVVVLCMIFQLVIGLDSSPSALFAQIISSVVCLLLNFKRGAMKKLPQAISNGCMQTSMPMLATCAIVGYATLISSTAFYTGVMDSVGGLNMSPYLLVVLGTMVCSCLGADPLSGISMSMSTFGQTAIASGASAALVHRLTVAASTTFDSMPYSGNLNCTLGFLGLSFKDVYKNIVVVQIGATCAATAVGLVIAMIIG